MLLVAQAKMLIEGVHDQHKLHEASDKFVTPEFKARCLLMRMGSGSRCAFCAML